MISRWILTPFSLSLLLARFPTLDFAPLLHARNVHCCAIKLTLVVLLFSFGSAVRAEGMLDKKPVVDFPITNKHIFTFSEVIYGKDDALCQRFIRGRADFELPDWKPAYNVTFQHNLYVERPPEPLGGWAELDFGNGVPMIAYSLHFGRRFGQVLDLLAMDSTEFQATQIDRRKMEVYDGVAFSGEDGTSLVKSGRYRLREADAIRKARPDVIPEFEYYHDFVSPVIVDGQVYVMTRATGDDLNLDSNYVDGMLFRYNGLGDITELCHFADIGEEALSMPPY